MKGQQSESIELKQNCPESFTCPHLPHSAVSTKLLMTALALNSNNKGPFKGGARRQQNNKIYGNPLPLVFLQPETSRVASVLNLLGLSVPSISNPHCEGYFDTITRSVWVLKEKDSLTLWRRGFFGKGDLSRSEPSWLARQINSRQNKAAGSECSSQRTMPSH